MDAKWEEKLSCAKECPRCKKALDSREARILSVYDDEAICLDCKRKEEEQPNYAEVSKNMVGQCLADVELMQGDPGGYCFHHFYPYTCKK